jgi:DNA-binding NarL/FixJ family response regulator
MNLLSGSHDPTKSPALRILIADDNATIRTILREFLESEPGWTVCAEASNGKDALEKTLEFKPDLLLLDLSMPEYGGLTLCQSIRKQAPELKILLVSEQDASVMKATLASAQADGFVVKSEIVTSLKNSILQVFSGRPPAGTES